MLQTISGLAPLALSNPFGLSLAQTLDCGQCFRWELQPDGSWTGVAGRRVYSLREKKNEILATCLSNPAPPPDELASFFHRYFDLGTDYQTIQGLCERHRILKEAAQFSKGIRILRQDPWEALCTFILSQNNNIKRITGLVNRLCEHFGEPIPAAEGRTYFTFPAPEALAPLTVEDLAPVRCGFRAKYILDAAKKVASREIDLEGMEKISTPESMDILMGIKGVGPKVAQCALLFGLHKMDCLPRDVWIGRAMDKLFPEGFPQEVLPMAGVVQQYLFHYVRYNPEVLEVDQPSKQ